MKPDVFEHNLRLLLGRSWERIEPDVEFAQRLERACAERAAAASKQTRRGPTTSKAPPGATARFRPVPLVAALAAAAAVLWMARPLWRSAPGAAQSLEAILAAGEIALRPAAGGPWRSVAAGSSLVAGEATTAQLPASALLDIGWDEPAAHAEIGPGGSVRFGQGEGLELARGGAEVTAGSLPFALRAGQAQLEVQGAQLRVSVHAPEAAPEDVALTVLSGVVRLADGRVLAPQTAPYRIVDGILLDPIGVGPAETGPEDGPGRVSVPTPDAGAPEDDGSSAQQSMALLQVRPRTVDGEPIPGFRLWLRLQVSLPQVAQAEATEVRAGDDPLTLDPGTYTVAVEAPGYAPELLRDVALAAGPNPELDVILGTGRPLAGFVVDAATGSPIQSALVVIESRLPHEVIHAQGLELEPLPYASGRTDASGRWEIAHAPIGDVTLRAIAANHAPARQENLIVRAPAAGGAPQAVPHFELLPGASLVGTVEQLDGSAWVGTPVIASRVRAEGGDAPMTYGQAETGPDGSFRMDSLPSGNYVVLLPVEAASGQRPRIRHAYLSGTTTRTVRFPGAVDRASGVKVRLMVRHANGDPAAAINLTLTSNTSGEWQSTSTDSSGAGELVGVASGSYDVALALGNGYDSMVFGHTLVISTQPEQVFELVAGPIRLTGSNPQLTGGFVYLERLQGGRWQPAGNSQVDRTGTWNVVGLQPGRVRGALFGRDASEGYAAIPETDLLGDAVQTLELDPQPAAQLTVRLSDEQGNPVPDASIVLRDGQGLRLLFAANPRTDAGGRLALPIVPSGTWTVEARTADGRQASVQRFFTAGEAVEMALGLE